MATIHRLDAAATGMRLDGAVEAFLTEIPNANTARAYALALRALVTELGAEPPVRLLDEEAAAERIGLWFARHWVASANATANARLDALHSAAAWWRTQHWITGDPTRRLRRRPRIPDRTRSLSITDIATPLTRTHLPLRERTLWRMLYETAARAQEVLTLDVGG